MSAVWAVIPARWGSTRLPGKALAEIGGRPLVVRVWEQARKARRVDRVVVATDDARIAEAVASVGGEAVLTGTFASGTDRVAFVASDAPEHAIVVNVQGDQPFLNPDHVDRLVTALEAGVAPIATLAAQLDGDVREAAKVKVVRRSDGRALYFSREPIPRGGPFLHHVGVYAFRASTLRAVAALPVGGLERAEDLEQLRWMEAGFDITVEIVEHSHSGVDTPEQLHLARAMALAIPG